MRCLVLLLLLLLGLSHEQKLDFYLKTKDKYGKKTLTYTKVERIV